MRNNPSWELCWTTREVYRQAHEVAKWAMEVDVSNCMKGVENS